MRSKKKRIIYLTSSTRMPFFQTVQVKPLLESIFLKLGTNSMRFTFTAFIFLAAAFAGEYCGRFAVDYLHAHVEKKVQERLEGLQKKGKPIYCSLFK